MALNILTRRQVCPEDDFLIEQHDLLAFSLANPTHAEGKTQDHEWADISLLETGIVRIEPKQDATISLVLSAGIHGNETAPMELVNQILKDVLDMALTCSVRLLVIFGNLPAANLGQRFIEINMNRLFSGAWKKEEGFEPQRAGLIEKSIADFFADGPQEAQRIHYDLHTAIRGSKYPKFVVYPYLHERPYSSEQLGFLEASGIEAVLLSHQSTTTLSYFSSELHQADAFTVELGQVAGFGQNDLTKLSEINKTLRHLISASALPSKAAAQIKVFQVIDVLNKDAQDYQLNIDADFENFTSFDAGFKLSQSNLSHYLVQQEGDALVFPNTKLPIGQRAGLMVREVSLAALNQV
ncbi:succinylglutamate desuccinylase [Marinomonas sp. 42_23_T18]|nr:succinylglutamate desuccinylase [Marinomonas sp. 42_23_T18]